MAEYQVDIIEEPERGCGQRHSGQDGVGVYLVGGGIPMRCDRVPMPLPPCETCGHQYGHSRGFTWINPQKLFGGDYHLAPIMECDSGNCHRCPFGNLDMVGDKAGMLWVGSEHYTVEEFTKEAFSHPNGICRRVNNVPNDFIIGKHIIYLAHIHAISVYSAEEDEMVHTPGVFMAYKPQRVELVIDDPNVAPERAATIKDKYGDRARLVVIRNPEGDECDSSEE